MEKYKELSEQDIAFENMLKELKQSIESSKSGHQDQEADGDNIPEGESQEVNPEESDTASGNVRKKNAALSEKASEVHTRNLTGQLRFDIEKEQDPAEKERQGKKKLNEFLGNTTNISSGESIEKSPLFQTNTTGVHKISKEEIEKFRHFEVAESQVLRYQEFKKLRSAKAEKFVLNHEKDFRSASKTNLGDKTNIQDDSGKYRYDDHPNIDIQLPNPNIYENQQARELEYQSKEDAEGITNKLAEMEKVTFFRVIGLILLSAFSLYSLVAPEYGLPIFDALIPEMPAAFLLTNLVVLALAIALAFPIIISGIRDIIALKINHDSMVSLVSFVCVLQAVILFVMGADIMDNQPNVFVLAPIAVWSMWFSCFGRYLMVKRAEGNFKVVSSDGDKYASGIIANEDLAAAFTRGTVSRKPYVSHNRKTGFISNFIYYSFLEDVTDQLSFYLFPAGIGVSLILGVICGYMSESFAVALTGFTAGICICSPLCYVLSSHVPISIAQKNLNKRSAAVLGFEAPSQFGNLNAVLTSAHKLFPRGTVSIEGMRNFSSAQSIDQSMIDAASVLYASKSILRDMFMDIILCREDILKPVDSVLFEDTMGVSAWVDNRRVIIGNRQMLINHNIIVPDLSEERRFCPEDFHLIYIAISGVLNAAFIFSVKGNDAIRSSLVDMLDNSVYLIVQTVDPVITKEMLSEVFAIDEDLFKILPARYHDSYKKQTSETEESDSPVINDGTFTSYVQSIITSKRLRTVIFVMVTLSIASVILGMLMLFVLGAINGLQDFGPLKMLAYQIIWTIVILMIPAIKNI